MGALARWCFNRRKIVLAAWLIAFVVLFGVNKAANPAFSNKFQLNNTASFKALNLLEKDFPSASGSSDQLVLHATTSTFLDPTVRASVAHLLASLGALPHVDSVTSPFTPETEKTQISGDSTVAFATIHFDEQSESLPKAAVLKVISVAEKGANSQFEVALGGQDIEAAQQKSGSISTILGIFAAIVVLGIAFGALYASFLPLIIALLAIGVGYALTGLITHVMTVATFSVELGVLIGLGVGVDYALFIVTRHRAGLREGQPIESSAVNAINTAGRAVFFAGITVCIALLGQFALGISFLYGVAVTAAITVAMTMLASLTLLPAMLGFLGMKVLSRRQRRALRASGPVPEDAGGFWHRWAKGIERGPLLPALTALITVIIIALPIFTLHLGLDDAGTDAAKSTTRVAYDTLAKGFGPGFNGPLQLVAVLPSPSDLTQFQSVVTTVGSEQGVVKATPASTNPAQTIAIAEIYPSTSPESVQTASLVQHLRDDVIPKAQAGTGLNVLVGGSTAIQTDFSHVLASKLPLFVGVVVVLAFLLLMAVFRSLLIPAIASIMNLLSVGASLGIMNAVFEWGWGKSLFGISEKAPVEVFVPVLLFSILFGLSMDYEVFLVSRIHESWLATGDNDHAVTTGQAETGRVITAAATIMILVFASFVLEDNVIIKQFGIGLAGAIIIDAFIVRTLIVPSLMHLAGKANWWLPKGLDRIVPHIHVEAGDTAPVPSEPVPVGVGVG